MLSELVSTYTRIYSQHSEKSSISFKFNLLSLPYLKLGNSREYRHALSIFSAPPRAMRVVLQLQMTVTIILCAFFRKRAPQIKVMHCHPPRTTPRFARRYAAPNDSPFYSMRFLRLGERAPTKRDKALSSSAFHSALRALLHSSE